MSASHLVVVAPSELESAADKIRRLQTEARILAREQVEALAAALEHVSQLAGEVVEGGEFYPVGARELAARLVEDANKRALALNAILERS
jgi:hypothetical protein